jgi:hypothetical protein
VVQEVKPSRQRKTVTARSKPRQLTCALGVSCNLFSLLPRRPTPPCDLQHFLVQLLPPCTTSNFAVPPAIHLWPWRHPPPQPPLLDCGVPPTPLTLICCSVVAVACHRAAVASSDSRSSDSVSWPRRRRKKRSLIGRTGTTGRVVVLPSHGSPLSECKTCQLEYGLCLDPLLAIDWLASRPMP